MATAINFHWANMHLVAPEGAENVGELHAFTNGICSVSCWELSPEELQEVMRTGRIFLSVLSGQTQPPVFIGSEDEVRAMIADYGVWRRA